MSRERIDRAWLNNKVANGVHCVSGDLAFYEISGLIGYDFVWIDTEHAAITKPMVLSAIAATQASGAAAFVRIADNDPILAKPILEMGPDGIIFPMICSAEQAKKAISACLYPPEGIRGYGPLRANKYGEMATSDYMSEVNKKLIKAIQIEHITAIKNIDEILQVKGIDLVVCGPMDLSASINKAGKFNDPEVRALFDTVINKCKQYNIPFGISMGYNLEERDYWIKAGAKFMSMGNPYMYFKKVSKEVLNKEYPNFLGEFYLGD